MLRMSLVHHQQTVAYKFPIRPSRTQNTSTTKQHIFVKRKIGMADWIIPFWRPFLRLKTFNMSLHFRLKSAHGFRTRAERIAKVSFRGKFENVCTKLLSVFFISGSCWSNFRRRGLVGRIRGTSLSANSSYYSISSLSLCDTVIVKHEHCHSFAFRFSCVLCIFFRNSFRVYVLGISVPWVYLHSRLKKNNTDVVPIVDWII